jgi:hypothetical protein
MYFHMTDRLSVWMGHSPKGTTPTCSLDESNANYAITTLEGKNFPRLPCGMYTPAQNYEIHIVYKLQ